MIRLVIVDDMPDIRNYLAEELAAASEQFSVVGAAEDGTEAVKLVDSLLPDVVLMDIQMKTRTEGIYAIRIIHERHPDIKCIALTIHEDDELIFQAYLAGAADYIIKTRSIDTIKNSILAVVNNRLLLRPEVGQRLIQEYQRVQNQENRMKETMQVMLKINTTEYEILRMACAGMSYKQMARERYVEETTIRSQINHILKKFQKNRMKDVVTLLNELGKTGLHVSEIGFGAWAIGGQAWGNDITDKNAMAALQEAWQQGINLFDTADCYGDGHSEALIGAFLLGQREKAVIVTKGGTNYRVKERSKDFTRDYLIRSLDESLERLQTDYVDVYLLHVPNAQWQDEAHVLDTLREIKNSGKAHFVGLAMWGAADTLHALEKDTDAVLTSEPLASGVLTGKYHAQTDFADGDHRKGFWNDMRWETMESSLREIAACAKEAGMSMAELALAYNLSTPGVTCVIPGGKTPEQVRKNVQAAGLRIPEDMRQRLADVPGFVS